MAKFRVRDGEMSSISSGVKENLGIGPVAATCLRNTFMRKGRKQDDSKIE